MRLLMLTGSLLFIVISIFIGIYECKLRVIKMRDNEISPKEVDFKVSNSIFT